MQELTNFKNYESRQCKKKSLKIEFFQKSPGAVVTKFHLNMKVWKKLLYRPKQIS